MSKKRVAILMGNDSGLEVMKKTAEAFREFESEYEIHVMSAHRTPGGVMEYTEKALSKDAWLQEQLSSS